MLGLSESLDSVFCVFWNDGNSWSDLGSWRESVSFLTMLANWGLQLKAFSMEPEANKRAESEKHIVHNMWCIRIPTNNWLWLWHSHMFFVLNRYIFWHGATLQKSIIHSLIHLFNHLLYSYICASATRMKNWNGSWNERQWAAKHCSTAS